MLSKMKLIPRTLIIVGGSILLLTAIAAFLLEKEMRSELKLEIEYQMVATLSFIRSQLQERVDENRHIVDFASRDPRVAKLLQDQVLLTDGQAVLDDLVNVYPQLLSAFLVDRNGNVVVICNQGHGEDDSKHKEMIGSNVNNHPLYKTLESVALNKSYFNVQVQKAIPDQMSGVAAVRVSPPDFDPWIDLLGESKEEKKRRMRWFVAPVKVEGELLGELVVVERWQQVTDRVLESIAHNLPQDSGLDEIEYLDADQGQVISAWPPYEAGKGSDHEHEDTIEWRLSLWGDEPAVRYLSSQEDSHHVTQKPQSFTQGHLIHIVYEEEVALAPLEDLQRLLYISLFLFALFLLAIISWEMRSIVLNRISLLYRGAQALTRGDLSYRLEDQSGDELGMLSKSFNQMTKTIEKVQQDLMREKAQSVSILESMQEGVLVLDRSGVIQMVNPMLENLTGERREKLVGKPFNQLFAKEEVLRDRTDSLNYIVQERLQELVGTQQILLHEFCIEAAVGTLIIDQSGVVESVNGALELLSEWSAEQLVGGNLSPLLPLEMGGNHDAMMQAVIERGKPRGMKQGDRISLKTQSGDLLSVEIGLFPLTVEGETKVLAVVHDPSDTQLWDIFASTPFGRLFLDEGMLYVQRRLIQQKGETMPVQISGAMLRQQQEQGSEIVGSVLVLHDVRDRIWAEKQEQLADFQSGVAEMSGSVLHNIGNVITGMSGNVIRTRRKIKQLEKLQKMQQKSAEQIRTALQSEGDSAALTGELEKSAQVMEAMAKFVGQMSHSFDESGDLDKIETGIVHVGDIIALHRNAARPVIQSTEFELVTMVNETYSLIEDRFEKAEVQFETELDPVVNLLFLPRNPLMQLLLNFLKNALEAISEERSGKETFEGRVLLRVVPVGDAHFEMMIADNGCGHDPEAAHKLFRVGYTTKEAGSGFGLNSAAKLVRSLGGTVTAESEGAHQGMRMIVTLPLLVKEDAEEVSTRTT